MPANIPVIMVTGHSLAEAWEKSLLELYTKGFNIKTEYDKSNDPPCKATAMGR